MKRRTPKADDTLDASRLNRILEQAEAHGGLKQMDFSWLERRTPPRPPAGGAWCQLEFPWGAAG